MPERVRREMCAQQVDGNRRVPNMWMRSRARRRAWARCVKEKTNHTMMKELRKLSEQGVPRGCQWSRALCPFIWTALELQSEFQVEPGYRRWGLDMVRPRFGEEMRRRYVSTPMQLRGWMRVAATADIRGQQQKKRRRRRKGHRKVEGL